jgi:hypothetical protein
MRLPNGAALGVVALLCGCTLYANVQAPYAWRSQTAIDVKASVTDPVATGKSCSRSVLWMFSWGNFGYQAAVQNALKNSPQGSMLYDVKNDERVKTYFFGVYSKVCTIVEGKVGRV